MRQKSIIASVLFLFALSALFLFWQNARELDPDHGKIWWTLAFASPEEPASLAFIVENHASQEAFQYEVSTGNASAAEGDFMVKRGDTMVITPALSAEAKGRTKITVSLGTEKKEIYR